MTVLKPKMLVVEDEVFIRLDFVALAQANGFETVEAASAAEAVEVLQDRDDVRVVFTDIRMPGDMDGLALSHLVRDKWPLTVIVICSSNEPPPTDQLPPNTRFVSKPCTGPQTERLLSTILTELAQQNLTM